MNNPICHCQCHDPNLNMMHCMPCCDTCTICRLKIINGHMTQHNEECKEHHDLLTKYK